VKVELSTEDLAPVVDEAVRRVLADSLADLALVSTKRAAAVLDVSENTFLTLAAGAGLRPVPLGPRLTRWRLADVRGLVTGTGSRVTGEGRGR
jgi:hypothetical protein